MRLYVSNPTLVFAKDNREDFPNDFVLDEADGPLNS